MYRLWGVWNCGIWKKVFVFYNGIINQFMRDKTGFRNRTELAVRARESGLAISEQKSE